MESKQRIGRIIAGLYGFTAVAMGAVGAHMLKETYAMALVEKASFYQLIFAGVIGWLSGSVRKSDVIAKWIFSAGVLLFSGSLYLKAFTGWEHATALAPLGGTLLMGGWLVIVFL
jgi:uncharacterized membrane protein YgdD (TMEM256/DUF423 family)